MVRGRLERQSWSMTTTPSETPPPPPAGDPGPRVSGDQVRDLGRLRRSVTDRKVAGVAGGLARHLDVDPLILRVLFVVLVFFGGAGLIIYGACWLLVPEEGSDRSPFNLDERSRTVALIVVGVIAALALVGDSWGAFWFPWPLAVIALVAVWLLTRNSPPPEQPPYQPAQPQAYQPQPYPPQPYPPATPPVGPPQANPYAAPSAGPTPAPPAPPYHHPVQPSPYVAAAPIRVPNPRKRGPILFWFTLALIALAEGVLGILDLAGAGVAAAAYPALAVGISGLMLLVGAFFGRAGGIILLGLVSTVALTGATAADSWDGESVTATPTTAAAVDSRYWLSVGEQVVDLREVTDLERLAGRTIEVDGGIGRIEVIVPDDLAVEINADVNGPGNIDLFGSETGGIDVSKNSFQGSGEGPELTIDAELGVGQIEVHR